MTIGVRGLFLLSYLADAWIAREILGRDHVAHVLLWVAGTSLLSSAGWIPRTVRRFGKLRTTLFGLLAFAIFFLSLRKFEIDLVAGRITETWAGFAVRTAVLPDLNDLGYCVDSNVVSIRLVSLGSGPSFQYFLGVWPSVVPHERFIGILGSRPCL